jgi:hypothetical protein
LGFEAYELSGTAQIAVIGSTEQTKAGIREKGTKSGRARTVALTALAIEELRHHKTGQAEELLRVGVRQTDDMYVVAQADGQPLKPNSLTHEFVRFVTSGTAMRRICWRAAFIPKSRKSVWVTLRSRSRWTCIHMCCPACKPTPRRALTRCCEWS